MGINEAFSDNLGSGVDQTCNCCNFVGDKLCNFKKWEVFFTVFKENV